MQSHLGKTTDKWHLYLSEYARLFEVYRSQEISLLEIGVQNGGSLEVWSQYFHQARVLVGCDIDEACRGLTYADARVNVVVGDACSAEIQDQILKLSPSYDLIIDDGSHTSSDIVKSFALYFGALSEGGLYVAEDLHCSYWHDFEGGLRHPLSSIQFFKLLCDIVNHQSWGLPLSRRCLLQDFSNHYGAEFSEELLAQVHSVEFLNSMCVIRKAAAQSNTLGLRIVRGREALVNCGPLSVDGQELLAPLQSVPAMAAHPKAATVVFDEEFYLSCYPDVAAAGLGALEHYLSYGKAEGRYPTADRAVLASVQEARAWGLDQAGELAEVVAERTGALAQTIEASQKQLELWHLQQAERFDQMSQAIAEQEAREVKRQYSLGLDLSGLRADLSVELGGLVLEQGVALVAAIEAAQSKLDRGQTEQVEQLAAVLGAQAKQAEQAQRQQVALFDLMAKSIAEQEAREVKRQYSLGMNLSGLRADLFVELGGLVSEQGVALVAAIEAAQSKLDSGQARHSVEMAAMLSAQARQAEQAQRQQEGLQGEFSAFKAEFAQVNAAYLDAKQTNEARVAALSADLEGERARLAWRAAHPFNALWRDLFSRKPAGADA